MNVPWIAIARSALSRLRGASWEHTLWTIPLRGISTLKLECLANPRDFQDLLKFFRGNGVAESPKADLNSMVAIFHAFEDNFGQCRTPSGFYGGAQVNRACTRNSTNAPT